jgi:ferric-dicitrate binding protein FerR (iron transport regulator)
MKTPFLKIGPCLTKEELARYRSLEGTDRDRIDRHLSGCMNCFALLSDSLEEHGEEEGPSTALLRRVESLPSRMAYRRSRRSPVPNRQNPLLRLAVAAALLLAIGSGFLFLPGSSEEKEPVHVMTPSSKKEESPVPKDLPGKPDVDNPSEDPTVVEPKVKPNVEPKREPSLTPEPEKEKDLPDSEREPVIEKPKESTVVKVLLSRVEGTLLCRGEPLSSGSEISPGDPLRTPFGTEARVTFAGGTVWVDHQTEIQMDQGGRLHLRRGKIYLQSAPGLKVQTPAGFIRPQGTKFQVETDAKGTTRVVVQAGRVRFENGLGGRNILAGCRVVGKVGKRPGPSIHMKNPEEVFLWVKGIDKVVAEGEDPFLRLYRTEKKVPLLFSAPHVPVETQSKEIATFLAQSLDAPLIVGSGFKGPRGIDLNEPGKSEASRTAFLAYVEALRKGEAGFPIPFLVEIHAYGEKDGESPVIEIATSGFRKAELERIKNRYEELVKKLQPQVRARLVFDLTDPTYEVDGVKRDFKYKSTLLRSSGVFQKKISLRGWKVSLPWEVRYTSREHYRTILLELLREIIR